MEDLDSSFEIFSSQSSTDSSSSICQRDIIRIFPKAVYCCSKVDQSLWVLSLEKFGWSLLRTNSKSSQPRKEDFSQCCTIPSDQFVKEISDFDSDPFSDDFGSPVLPPPVIHLVSSKVGHDVQISQSLFRQLFQRETILSAAVATHPSYPCLLGLPDGRVLYWHPATPKITHVVCHMYQPVIAILAGPKGCLLCVGQHGKLICILSHKENAEFSCVFLHGPVTSCTYNQKHLFHTTSSYHLWRSTIMFDSNGQASVLQTQVTVLSAKTVKIDSLSNKVTYISEDNILSDVPDDLGPADAASQHQKLHWLSNKISEQSTRTLQLTQHTEKFSSLMHDLTCAAWLLTPDKCELKCQYEVLPVPGQENTYNLRIIFSELGKLCPSSLWSVCSTVGQQLGSAETKLAQTVPICNDIVQMDLSVPICLGSKVESWGGHFRPPLNVECSVLFGGIPIGILLASRPCPAMKFVLQTFVLDELSFLTEKSFRKSHHTDSVDSILLKIAKQKGRLEPDRPSPLNLPGKVQCSLKALIVSDDNIQGSEDLIWQKILPEHLRNSKAKIFSLLGHEIRFWTNVSSESADEARQLSLFIETDCASLLAGLRTSAVNRIQSICDTRTAEVSLSKEAMTKAQALQTELQILRNSQSFEKALQFYLKLRNEFSSNLLLV